MNNTTTTTTTTKKARKAKTVEVPRGKKVVFLTEKQLQDLYNIMATIDDESHQDFKDALWTNQRSLDSICDALNAAE